MMQCKLLLLVSRWGNAAYPCLQQLYWISENKINETTERPSQMNKQFLRFCSKSEKKHTHTKKEKRKHGQKKNNNKKCRKNSHSKAIQRKNLCVLLILAFLANW